MDPTAVAFIAFLSIAVVIVAVAMVVHDLFYRKPDAGSARGPLRLGRLPLARNEVLAESSIGRFDQWFARLVTESGIAWSPLTAVLVLVFFGTLIGGIMYVVTDAPFPATVGMFLGMFISMGFLIVQRFFRIRKMQDQLPGALEMLSRAVHAGESLDQALELVGEKTPEPLGIEFRRAARQLEMGLSLAAVMRSLVYRVRLSDVQVFTTTLTVHRQSGGNLARTLERLAAVIRERLNFRRQLRATTGAGRMSAILIGGAGPLLFIWMFVMQRQYLDGLINIPLGQGMLVAAFLLEIVGLIWVARVLKPAW